MAAEGEGEKILVIIPLFLIAALATYPLILLPEKGILWLSTISLGLWTIGGLSKRYSLCVAGGFLIAGEYVGSLVAGDHPVDLWGAILFGLGLFLALELSYDLTTLFRRPSLKAVWGRRSGYFLQVSLLSLAVSLAVVLIASNALKGTPTNLTPWLTLLGIGTVIACIGFIVRLWMKER